MIRLTSVVLRHEVRTLLVAPSTWPVLAGFWLLCGSGLWLRAQHLTAATALPELLYGSLFYWLAVVLLAALAALPQLAGERQNGTDILLRCAALSDAQVVIAKFVAAWLACLGAWLLPPVMVGCLYYWVNPAMLPDWLALIGGYMFTALLSAALCAIAMAASAFARSLAGAAAVMAVLLSLFCGLAWLVDQCTFRSVQISRTCVRLDLQLADWLNGTIRLQSPLLMALVTFTALAIAIKYWKARRWT